MGNNLIAIKKKKLTTTSIIVAEKFCKKHDRVLRKIEHLISADKSNRLNFGVVKYLDKKGEYRKMYSMDRGSFSILAMGFNGDKP